MNGFMGLLVAHSVAGKKLPSKDRSRLLLTSALLPAPGVAGVLMPMALAQKEVAEHERRVAQSAASTQADAAQKMLQAIADAAKQVLDDPQSPQGSASTLSALASAFSLLPNVAELVAAGLVRPVVVKGQGSEVQLEFGTAPVASAGDAWQAVGLQVKNANLVQKFVNAFEKLNQQEVDLKQSHNSTASAE